MESVKSDCACALQRKAPENLPAGFEGTLSPVRFEGKTYGIAAIFSDSCSNAAQFLCSLDCVAEREGFEVLSFAINTLQVKSFRVSILALLPFLPLSFWIDSGA
jgi:hypothetical protein